ncbi:MAG: class I SAM-dependent methyltransferase [Gammaproteobacteria bacterium]
MARIAVLADPNSNPDHGELVEITPGLVEESARLAGSLKLPCVSSDSDSDFDFLLRLTGAGLQFVMNRPGSPGPVWVDFENPTLDYRIRNRVSKQAITRAVGVKPGLFPVVLDATAGLGKDAYLLATTGCQVKMLERDPIIFALLEDGMNRARESQDDKVREAVSRMSVLHTSLSVFAPAAKGVDVVYLDPMFPERSKSAQVKKDMYVLQQYFATTALSSARERDNEARLLRDALAVARRRVVVKRPARAGDLAGQVPSFRLAGKSSRFDVYVTG